MNSVEFNIYRTFLYIIEPLYYYMHDHVAIRCGKVIHQIRIFHGWIHTIE